MKKICILIISIIFLTSCSLDDIKNDIDNIKSQGDCPGWKENGQCCTAKYSGQSPDSSGDCPGAQLPGDKVYPKQDENKCYIASCNDIEQ